MEAGTLIHLIFLQWMWFIFTMKSFKNKISSSHSFVWNDFTTHHRSWKYTVLSLPAKPSIHALVPLYGTSGIFFFFMHILSLNLYSSRMKLGPAGPLLDSQDLASRLAHDRCSININERLSEHPHHLLLLPIYISPTQPISLCDVPTLIEMLSWWRSKKEDWDLMCRVQPHSQTTPPQACVKHGQDAKGSTKMTWDKWDGTTKAILDSRVCLIAEDPLPVPMVIRTSGCWLGITLSLLSTWNHQDLTFLFFKAWYTKSRRHSLN